MEIRPCRVYRAKVPCKIAAGYYNDRQVIHVNDSFVCYIGPSVPAGSHRKCLLQNFRSWAGEDVTDRMPQAGWMRWGSDSTKKVAT
jgi:hypothetical protein